MTEAGARDPVIRSPSQRPTRDREKGQEDSMSQTHHPRRLLSCLAVAVAAVFCSAALSSSALAASKPTVVLVHGAFADASGWNAVANRLQSQGYPVLAPSNPLRGVSSDSAYVRNVLAQIE